MFYSLQAYGSVHCIIWEVQNKHMLPRLLIWEAIKFQLFELKTGPKLSR